MLQGQVVLVTGASRGIGKAILEGFGRAGATVIGTATSESGPPVFPMHSARKAGMVTVL